ncbi:ubiquinone/menaquinone biosynthesis C-methylase UbiE [Nocardia alba]|uniref:Ubiquinone/menaquinone biosynthesis C-methylase UbiE n=1 Tax=Nocardia alba TaxID=225051 RepID=A0A4R1FWH3_9NOCA|nr:ubiquinone/menaquinone biosynthesis C-methylase UbiE [Nocardia alba]
MTSVDRVPDHIVQAAYTAVHARYIELFGSPSDLAPEDAAFALTHLAPGPVLDLGCGPGHFTKLLTDAGIPATGMDLVPEFIAHARATYPDIPFELGSIRALDAPTATVSAILAWFSLIHLPPEELPTVLAEFHRALTPNGRLVIGVFESSDAVEPFPHKVTTAFRYPTDQLSEILREAGFTEVDRLHHPAAGDTRPHCALAAVKS